MQKLVDELGGQISVRGAYHIKYGNDLDYYTVDGTENSILEDISAKNVVFLRSKKKYQMQDCLIHQQITVNFLCR